MFFKLFLAFTLIPVAEIYLLLEVGSLIGSFNTILLIILSGFSGAYLARLQGLRTMFRVRASLQQGIMPAEELIDALIILVAGIVLLTPGFLTDAVGLLLLFPITRRYFKLYLKKKLNQWVKDKEVRTTYFR